MNISTNSVGNYKPVNNIANKNVSNIQNAKNESVNDITKEEKNILQNYILMKKIQSMIISFTIKTVIKNSFSRFTFR